MKPSHYTLQYKCPDCGYVSVFQVPSNEWNDYIEGKEIDDAFTSLSKSEREILKSGTCLECQANAKVKKKKSA